ncbi:feruloyl-CoA synthase [Variovorax paradoxus]|nr:feruloyl-CoA synthase [Variovorax paradoxus]
MPTMTSGLRLARAAVAVEQRPDGAKILCSPTPLKPHARTVSDWLARWAEEAPDRVFLAERRGGEWHKLLYADAADQVLRLSEGLLCRGLGPEAPLMILSDNGIEHALLALAAMHVGIPVAPISPAYSVLSQDHAKLRQIAALLRPGAVYACDPARYAKALQAIGRRSLSFAELVTTATGPSAAIANAAVTPDTVAKILFTSGSTGSPKGVINTQRMLTANQQQSLQVWPFLQDAPPTVVDWLPWNHTFGGNYNFHLVLSNGGTMYIDGGKPVPTLFEESVRNLREIAPTVYFNVPRGFDLLLPQLEQDRALRRHLFSRCRFFFYAGAALPQNAWDRFQRVAREETGADVALVSAWGATETAPLCLAVHFPIDRAGVVGLPVPGCELKLVPSAGKLEARVRGPNISPGYYGSPELTRSAFDDEGFYLIGDALRFLDPIRPERGLVFDGRVAEDFKLRTGTWVHVGALRVQLLAACDPIVQDAVLTGHDRDEIGALLFLHPAAAAMPEVEVRAHVARGLSRLNASNETGSATRVARALIQVSAPRADAGEITDKGYINQRAVLTLRAVEVERLHADATDGDVIFPVTHDAKTATFS